MKIITLHKPVDKNAVFKHIKENLNSQFKQQRQSDITFDIENKPEAIEIWQSEFYDGALFTIVVQDDELWITRNEHYVDDVNSVTLESILNGLFNDLSGGLGTDLVEEG